MPNLLQKGLAFLINSFQRTDIRLFQVLTALNDQTQDLVTKSNLDESILTNFEYRFELPGFPIVANDVYPVWKQVRLPLDSSNNTFGNGQKITRVDINAKAASAGTDFIVDILVTKDKGVTFNSIFPGTLAQKLVLPKTLLWIKYGGTFSLSADVLQDGWWFRIDVLQSDGTVNSPEIVIRGVLIGV